MRHSRAGLLIILVIVVVSTAAGVQYISGGSPVTSDGSVGDTNENIDKTASGDNSSNADLEQNWNLSESTGPRYPTDEQYVNSYVPGEPPKWIPESEFSMENHSSGTYEVTRYPNAEPTEEQLDAAWELYNKSFEAAKENGWFEFKNAVEDGYSLETTADNHWANVDNKSVYAQMDETNPNMPETLVYYEKPHEEGKKILAGYMYLQPLGSNTEGEQIGGPLTVWHYHPVRTEGRTHNVPFYIRELVNKSESINSIDEFFRIIGVEFKSIKDYIENRRRTSEMIHVWFVEHPEGPFGTSMSVPTGNLQEPEKMSEESFKNHTINKHRHLE